MFEVPVVAGFPIREDAVAARREGAIAVTAVALFKVAVVALFVVTRFGHIQEARAMAERSR